jgi:hypothetical protein
MHVILLIAGIFGCVFSANSANAENLNKNSRSMLSQVVREYGAAWNSVSVEQQDGRLFRARFVARSGNQVSCVDTYGVELLCCEIYPNDDSGNYIVVSPRN